MKQLRTNPDEVVDLHRRLAFADACLDTLNFDQMLTRVCSLLNEWVQADVVTLILPPEDESAIFAQNLGNVMQLRAESVPDPKTGNLPGHIVCHTVCQTNWAR